MNLKSKIGLFFLIVLFQTHLLSAQLNPLQKVDYSLIEDKILYVPTYESSSKYIDKMTKKGMYKNIAGVSDKAEYYNRVWKEALHESGLDTTSYKFTDTHAKDLTKASCEDCILLRYKREFVGSVLLKDRVNVTALFTVVHPKRQIISSANINGLDISDKNDIRLMLNILNSNLNYAITNYKSGTLNFGKMLEESRQNRKEFVENISDKTFLIPKPDASTKKGKKSPCEVRRIIERLDSQQGQTVFNSGN